MIDRYQTKEMKKLWSDQTKFNHFLKVELASLAYWKETGLFDAETLLKLEKAKVNAKDVLEIEIETKHDVIAFTKAATKLLGDEKKWFHYGLTSTDIVDTAQSLTLKKVNQIILKDIIDFMEVLKEKAYKYKDLETIGRTHGMHAEITSFGLKFALWYEDFKRLLNQFKRASKEIEICKMSGAVGNYSANHPDLEKFVAKKLKLKPANISTQVLQRDRHASYLSTLALIGAELEKIAVEIRHLSRTELHEVSESFSSLQKGSSAMPHKRNPISSENISGLSRVLKGYMITSYENISLWHERDISHSSAERIILSDSTTLVDYMLKRYTETIKHLVVHEDRVKKNIERTYGCVHTQQLLNELIKRNMDRYKAYEIIQKYAFHAMDTKKSFIDLVSEDKSIKEIITKIEINHLTDTLHYMRFVDSIYDKVFKNQ